MGFKRKAHPANYRKSNISVLNTVAFWPLPVFTTSCCRYVAFGVSCKAIFARGRPVVRGTQFV